MNGFVSIINIKVCMNQVPQTMVAIKQHKSTSLLLLHHLMSLHFANLSTHFPYNIPNRRKNERGKWRQREDRTPSTTSPLPHFPICYVLTSPLTHKSNTVELNSICTLRDSKQGGGGCGERLSEEGGEQRVGEWKGNDGKINRSLDCHSAHSFSHPSISTAFHPPEPDAPLAFPPAGLRDSAGIAVWGPQ